MTSAHPTSGAGASTFDELTSLGQAALAAVEGLTRDAAAAVRARVTDQGRLSNAALEREQHAAHGLAWLATYVEAIREMLAYAVRLDAEGRFGETERPAHPDRPRRISRPDFRRHSDEPGRIRAPGRFRPRSCSEVAARSNAAVDTLIATGNTAAHRARLVERIDHAAAAATVGDPGLDETLEAIRDGNPQIRRSRGHAARPRSGI